MITTLTFVLSFFSLLLLQTLIKRKLFPARKLPNPGPTTYPIIGCLVSFYKNRHRLLDWYTEMLSMSPSQTIVISRLGARRTVVTANPRNVEYMLKTNFENFPKGKPFTDILGDFLGKGIFNVDGDLWHHQRKLVSHEFNVRSLRDYVEHVLKGEVENKLVPVLESAAAEVESKPVDLQDLLRRLAFDLVCRVSLGFDPRCLDYGSSGESHPIIEAFDVASIMCAMRGAAPFSISWKIKRFFDVGPEKKLRKAITTIHAFIEDVINDRKRSLLVPGANVDANEHDLLSKLVLEGKKDEFVRDTMISFIMAGRDTTSAAMTWLFHLLSNHPDVETDVLREIELVEGEDGRNLSEYESLRELRLLKACICESMRLFPPVAWDSKHPLANDTLPDGTGVRAGDRVTYFPYGMGRMEGLWGEDRFEFKPERWVSEMDVNGRIKALKNFGPYKFPVFQAGPRVCLGKDMAFLQMKYVVASILKRFRFRPVAQNRPVFVPLLTAHMAGGFKVFVSPRRQ